MKHIQILRYYILFIIKGIFMNHLGYFIERMHEYGYANDTKYKSLI